jgi:hypothetical protein
MFGDNPVEKIRKDVDNIVKNNINTFSISSKIRRVFKLLYQ